MARLFSIIIPTLNEEYFLPRLLHCLSQQTFKEFEVIVVDGSSEDETRVKARAFWRIMKRLRVYTVRKRQVSYQRNYGAKKATGNYLIFFDADVVIPNDFIANVAAGLITSHAKLATTYLSPPNSDIRNVMMTKMANVGLNITTFVGKPTAGGFNIIVEKELFLNIGGFDPTLMYAEDYDFIQRCYGKGVFLRVLKTPRLIVSFRRYELQGYLRVLEKFITSSLHVLFFGPIREQLFEYPMGGHLYKNREFHQ